MADKNFLLIIDALSRAATHPEGVALIGSRTEAGLFPPTAAARSAAEQCKADGLLRVLRSEPRGKTNIEIAVLTEKGMQFLLKQASPRQVLEDFVRILETRQREVDGLLGQAKQMASSLQGMRQALEQVLPLMRRTVEATATLPTPPASTHSYRPESDRHGSPTMNGCLTLTAPTVKSAPAKTEADYHLIILEQLAEWHASAGASEDCPLPKLYSRLTSEGIPVPTIGQFHDCLRRLHDEHRIWLHPWTGPLYDLPEPAFALLVGHEIAYYASLR